MSPLTTPIEGMVGMPTWLPILASNTIGDPRVIIGVLTLSYFTSVFPIVSSTIVLATRARRVLDGWRTRVRPTCRSTASLCLGYLRTINGIALHGVSKLSFQAVVVVFFRQVVFRFAASKTNHVDTL